MIRVHTLGAAAIDIGDVRVTPISVRKFALLLHLAAEAGRRVQRSALCDLIYPDKTAKSAMHSLREQVYQFHQLGIPVNVDVDAVKIESQTVRHDYADILASEHPAPEQLKAVECGFLPGYAPDHSEAFREWLDAYRARTTFALCKRLLSEVAHARLIGDWQTTERAARACLALDALNEEATLALAEVLAIGGAKALAVNLLDHYMREIGSGSPDLKVSAAVLRRRIGERLPTSYASRLMSPFVGRGPQMIELRERFERIRAGDSQCVALIGEVGIGKSRLSSEFSSIAALEGAEVAATGCQPNDTHRPFSAFADLAPRLMQMPGALGCAPASLKAIERLTERRSVESMSFEEAIRDSEALCDSIAHALVDVIEAIASEQPLVLTIEDIRWADGMSTRVIVSLLSRRRARRVFVLLTSREADAVNVISRYTETVSMIELRGLDSASIERLTSELADQSHVQIDRAMHLWLEETSSGNPFFLEGLISHYAATNERFAVSPTLSRLVARRIKWLRPAAATTLQACALLGKHSTLDTIVGATELPRFELVRAIAELEEARLIVSDGEQVRTAHALIADITMAALTPIQARLAHRSVAEALERLLSIDGAPSLIWDCAEHWLAAENTHRAVEFLRRCATRALETGRPGDAAELLSKGLPLATRPETRKSIALSMAVAADRAEESFLALRAIESLDHERETGHHNEFEFIRFRARLRLMLATADDADRLLVCVAAANADADHRVVAATLILKFADADGHRSLALRATEMLPSDVIEKAPEMARLEFMILRATIFKDWSLAGMAGLRLIEAAKYYPIPARLVAQGNGLVALDRAGLTGQAIETAKVVFAGAHSAGLSRISARAAAYLCETFLDIGDDRNADEWFDTLQRLTDAFPELVDDIRVVVTELHRACNRKDSVRAQLVFDRAERHRVFSGGETIARFRTVMLAWINQIRDAGQPSDDELTGLVTAALEGSSSSNLRDIEAAVACRALLHAGRSAEAKSLYREYANVSRHGPAVELKYLQEAKALLFP